MKWLKVRITGQARMAFRKFPASVQTKYEECTKAFKQRFEPDSKKELYRAELTTRARRRDEDWATYGDVLRTLADKAYSDLEEKARERLALGTQWYVEGLCTGNYCFYPYYIFGRYGCSSVIVE